MARIGIYGGSFNPPHMGHRLGAEEMIRLLELDRLLIIPAAIPPHKALAADSPAAEHRMELCKLTFGGIPQAEICDLELKREGPSYTVDTLRILREQYPEDQLFLIMGTDMLLCFDSWREPRQIAALATLAVMHRESDTGLWQQVQEKASQLRKDLNADIRLVQNHCIEISSTTVRRMLALEAPDYLEPKTEQLILQNGWYQSRKDWTGLDFDTLCRISLSLHDEGRRAHVLGCSQTARELALRWGADPEAAARAGILHDVTKALHGAEQLRLCERYDLSVTDMQKNNPKLLHAKTGAAAAAGIFGESEPVCEAIRWHTTGRPQMTQLEKILYIADYMEPNRSFPGVDALRDLVWKDLDGAVWLGLEQSVQYLKKNNREIDPDSLAAWQFYHIKSERSTEA